MLLITAATSIAHAGGPCHNDRVNQNLLNLLPPTAPAATAVLSGPWSDPATWGGSLPGPGDDVRVPLGVTVTWDIDDDGDSLGADTTRFGYVRVDGVLTWATDRDTTMYVDTLFSSPTGVIAVGDDDAPISSDVRAEIVFIADAPMDMARDPEQLGRGFVPHGMTRIVGADKSDFAALATDATAGSTTLTLAEPPVGWAIGDTLVLGGTFFDPEGDNADNSRFHDEVLTIQSIDGATVTFTNDAPGSNGLRWDHERPDGRFFDPEDLTLYVANLSRNVLFRSELDESSPESRGTPTTQDLRRGHVMVMHTSDLVARNAAFVDLGRLNKNGFIDEPVGNLDGSPGLGTNQRGRYIFHLHRNLPRGGAPVDFGACNPAEVTGCVAWRGPGWGFVHHDSYALFRDNVAFDILGAAFVQEAGNEIGRWERNISIKSTGDDDPFLTVEPFGDGFTRVRRFDFGFNGEAYWIQGASQVEFVNNVAISAAGGGADIFSDVDGNDNRDASVVPVAHLPADRQHIVTNGSQTIAVNRVPTNTFTGFEVYNSDFGLVTWNHMRNQGTNVGYTCPCDANTHREYATIDDFRFWNIYGQGIHFQYSSQINLRDGLIASSDLATPGVDDKPALSLDINGDGRGYGLGMNGPTKRLNVENVAVEGWAFGVRTPLEGALNAADLGENTGDEGSDGLPLRSSRFADLRLANNTANFYRRQNGFVQTPAFPNSLVIEGGVYESTEPNAPPTADFSAESVGGVGVVRLSGLPSRDDDTPGEFLPPYHPLTVARNDDNYIVAYAWDLDGDGGADAYGEELFIALPLGEPRSIGLTVWDHQGATDSVVRTVTATVAEPYGELLVDGGFEATSFVGGVYALTSGGVDAGWWEARANLQGGSCVLTGQYGFASVAQAVWNNRRNRGEHVFSFDIEIVNGDGAPNFVDAKVYGVNGEFGSDHRGAYPRREGAVPVEITPLHEERFSGDPAAGRVERTIDLGGEGFDYLYVGFNAEGVSNLVAADFVRLDDVSLVGAAVVGPCSEADFGAPFGELDIADVTAFLAAFGAGDVAADGAAPFGSFDIADVVWFLQVFVQGCP
ncbi:MAG: hypothetical protein CMJ31_07385 [Phycisphaerae bacterium]|nr:hypothetical protein [Phycisphaerae bacterium]